MNAPWIGTANHTEGFHRCVYHFPQIPSQCMTCVAFQAVREYIVGKTAPVPVKVYDYYEPGKIYFQMWKSKPIR